MSDFRDLFLFQAMRLDRGSLSGRSALEARVVHVADVLADPDFTCAAMRRRSVAFAPRWALRCCVTARSSA